MPEKRMKRNGFTLMELLVVIAIMTTLMTIAGFSYNAWMQKYRLEGQVRELYVDLMNARVQAMQRNRVYFVAVPASGSSYSLIEDTNDSGGSVANAGDTTLWTKQLRFPSLWVGNSVVMNTRGLVSPLARMTFNTGGVDAAYDCIALSPTRIRMGKDNGTVCIAR